MNPLRVDNKPGKDTCYLVRSVLLFMTEAFDALDRTSDALPLGAMEGAGRIMSVCADALKDASEAESETGGGDEQ